MTSSVALGSFNKNTNNMNNQSTANVAITMTSNSSSSFSKSVTNQQQHQLISNILEDTNKMLTDLKERNSPIRALLSAFRLVMSTDFALKAMPYERDQMLRLFRSQLQAAKKYVRQECPQSTDRKAQLNELIERVWSSVASVHFPSSVSRNSKARENIIHQNKFVSVRDQENWILLQQRRNADLFFSPRSNDGEEEMMSSGNLQKTNTNNNSNSNIIIDSSTIPLLPHQITIGDHDNDSSPIQLHDVFGNSDDDDEDGGGSTTAASTKVAKNNIENNSHSNNNNNDRDDTEDRASSISRRSPSSLPSSPHQQPHHHRHDQNRNKSRYNQDHNKQQAGLIPSKVTVKNGTRKNYRLIAEINESLLHSRRMLCAPSFAILNIESQQQAFDLVQEQIDRSKAEFSDRESGLFDTNTEPRLNQLQVVLNAMRDKLRKRREDLDRFRREEEEHFVADVVKKGRASSTTDAWSPTSTLNDTSRDLPATRTNSILENHHQNNNNKNENSLANSVSVINKTSDRYSKASKLTPVTAWDGGTGRSKLGGFRPSHWMFSPPPKKQ